MSPEQLRGEPATPASDIWALGVVLYEMIAGARPFAGQTPFEVSAGILNDSPPPLPATVAPRLAAIVHRCLAKDAGQRFPSAAAVRQALETGATIAPAVEASPATPRKVAHGGRLFSLRRALVVSAIVLLAAGGVGGWRFWQTAGPTATFAVLPFANPANDPDLEYLCEGVAESLIRRLSTLPAIRISHLPTVLSFKERTNDPASVGRDLGVQTILVGTLRRDGAQLHITARLVDVATGRELWSNSYDRPAAELLNVQDDIANAITNEGLRLRLTSDDRRRMDRHPTTNGDAYDLYLQANYLQRTSTEEDYLYSRELLERAVNHDPKFALAYAAIAANYAMMAVDGMARPDDAWRQVRNYTRLAGEADPELSTDPIEHAVAFFFDWDWEGAARARERVLAEPLTTIVPDGLRALAIELWAVGKPEEALRLGRRMRELDPRAAYLAIGEADMLLRIGRFDDAIALYERTATIESGDPNLYFGLAEALFRRGRFDEALAMRRRAHMMADDDRLEPLFATAKGRRGYQDIDRAWAQIQLEMLKARAVNRYVSPLDFARIYAHLGDTEQAFKYLEASFEDRSPGLVFLKVDTAWDKIRSDPRFAEAIERVGLP